MKYTVAKKNQNGDEVYYAGIPGPSTELKDATWTPDPDKAIPLSIETAHHVAENVEGNATIKFMMGVVFMANRP